MGTVSKTDCSNSKTGSFQAENLLKGMVRMEEIVLRDGHHHLEAEGSGTINSREKCLMIQVIKIR
jgi:hypothetical protein